MEDQSAQEGQRLALVRHGRSSHVHVGWIDRDGFRRWREAYEAAGISDADRVPADVQQLTTRADLLLSSDAPRAVSSAQALAPTAPVVVSPLLRELDLEAPRLGGIRLPLAGWALAVAGRTLLLSLRQRHRSAAEAARIEDAAAWLQGQALQHSLTVAVTHGSFRRELAMHLLKSGWQADHSHFSIRHWSAWLFTRRPAGV